MSRADDDESPLSRFHRCCPRRPYATDDLSAGVWRHSKHAAERRRYIQFNEKLIGVIVFDCDHDGACSAARDGLLPEPNIITLNPDNGRGHLAYLLKAPVASTDAARRKPLEFLAAIELGLTRRLDADPGFAGLVTKNPFHPYWRTYERHSHMFELREFYENLHAANYRRPPSGYVSGLGRNCLLFDELRAEAYREVRNHRRDGLGLDAFGTWALVWAQALNNKFAVPLPFSEVKSIARSVAKWVWSRFDEARFSSIQSARGQRGNAKRWSGHVSAEIAKPWEAQGISRATYYRRRRQR